jgi:copper chaperone
MSIEIIVENIKCGGCANTITTKLKALDGVNNVAIDIEAGKVTIDGDDAERDTYAAALAKMGYPELGSVAGLESAGAKAKSFVSCAIGRMNK